MFFEVTSEDINVQLFATQDVISLKITEEMAKMDSGTISFYDPNNVYSRIVKPGAKLNIAWGITLHSGSEIRRDKMTVLVNSPSGSGSAQGVTTFNCNFMSLGLRGDQANRWYESGNKEDVVSEAMTRIGVPITNQFIDFMRGKDAITAGTKVAQFESDFKFLVRLADEWKATFLIGYDQTGLPCACFVDASKLKWSGFSKKISGLSTLALEYNIGKSDNAERQSTGEPNVLSYSWRDNSMDSAFGQGAQIIMVDGKPQIYRTVVEGETVTVWRLDQSLIEKELGSRDLTSRTALLAEYLSAKSFDQVKRFFVKDEMTTYPEGSGMQVNVNMMGDPRITAGLVASFGFGFPDRVGATDRTWWARKVTHKISKAGYFTDVEIVDAYSFSPTGTKITPVGATS